MKRRVLLVRLGAMGDVLHTLPLAADLHGAGWQVDWLIEDRWASLIAGSPVVDRLHIYPRAAWKRNPPPLGKRLAQLRQLKRELCAQRYQAAIDAQGLAKSALWALASGAKRLIGHAKGRAREGSWLVHRVAVWSGHTHVVEQNRALALPLVPRLPNNERFPLPAWTEEQARMDLWLAQQALQAPLALNVGAGWPSKLWPEHLQIAFCQLLSQRGQAPLLLWGGASEAAWAQRVHQACPHTVLAPKTSLPELAALLKRCRALVSADTGPLHLGMALGLPCLGLFGPVPAVRNGVRGPRSCNIQAAGRPWERVDAQAGGMHLISPQQVLQVLDRLLA